MKEHEIERLREKLGPEYSVKREGNLVAVELVDTIKLTLNTNDCDVEGDIYIFNTGGVNLIVEQPSDKTKLEGDHIEPIRVTAYASGLMKQVKHRMNITLEVSRSFELHDRFEFLNHIEEAIESYLNKIP